MKKKISGRTFGIIFSVSVGFIMALAMSFFMLLINVGYVEGFFFIWAKSFLIGFCIALPIAITIIPFIKNKLEKMFDTWIQGSNATKRYL